MQCLWMCLELLEKMLYCSHLLAFCLEVADPVCYERHPRNKLLFHKTSEQLRQSGGARAMFWGVLGLAGAAA